MDVHLYHVTVRRAARAIVDAVDLSVPAGEVLGVVGPNGSGKSTLLRCVYRALKPDDGAVHVDGTDIATQTLQETARAIAALPQDGAVDFDFSVADLVATGRYPHGHRGGTLSTSDAELLENVLAQCGLRDLRDRGISTLSGGERQRALLARALMQQPRVLVLDEPTNHLDIAHQLDLLAELRRPGRTVLVAIHDLNLAANACTRLAVLDHGRLVTVGTPREVLTDPAVVASVFGVHAQVVEHPTTGAPQLLFDLPTYERNPCTDEPSSLSPSQH